MLERAFCVFIENRFVIRVLPSFSLSITEFFLLVLRTPPIRLYLFRDFYMASSLLLS
jgi:hypothetical protein